MEYKINNFLECGKIKTVYVMNINKTRHDLVASNE